LLAGRLARPPQPRFGSRQHREHRRCLLGHPYARHCIYRQFIAEPYRVRGQRRVPTGMLRR
jgi:hypothetical protein